jgi:GntR family transcriptional repressor for pyruvate dehydrogenase complex
MSPETVLFQPVGRSPLSLLVARDLREAIVSGRLSIGTELPTEKELTEQFAVSRSTIREALRILQVQGLLTGGDTVSTARPRVSAEQTSTIASEALRIAVRMGGIPLADLMELRLVLEGAALATGNFGPHSFDGAREALKDMHTPGIDVATFHEADVRFHICLAGAGGNTVFQLVLSVLHDAIAGYLLDALAALEDPLPVLTQLTHEHAEILDVAAEGRGEKAGELMRAHIWNFYTGCTGEPVQDG